MRPPLLLGLSLIFGVGLATMGFRGDESASRAYLGRSKANFARLATPTIPASETHSLKSLPARVSAGHEANAGLFDAARGLFKRGPRDEKTLVLTFDDGPFPDSAGRMLDELKALDVKATFFVVGERVLARPDLVRRMIAEGHEVANHTHEHGRLHRLSAEAVATALRGCEDAVRKVTGRSMTLMRPPGMRYNERVLDVAREEGYVMVGYNSVAGDYVPNGGLGDLTPEQAATLGLSPETIADRIDRQIKPGTIVLLHDNPVTVEAIRTIVERARAKGYRFVTTAELMASLPDPVRIVANPPVANRRQEG